VRVEKNRLERLYEVEAVIGEGTFGEVVRVRDQEGKKWAVKKSKEEYLGEKDREMKLEEVKKHFKLSRKSKYCVELREAWEEKGHLYILSELCEKGNLDGYLVERC